MSEHAVTRPHLLCLSPFASERRGTLRFRTLPMLRRLRQLGWQITLLLPGWDLAPAQVNQAKWLLRSFDYHILPPLHRSGLTWQFHYSRVMVQWALRLQPDVVLAAKAVGAPALTINALRTLRSVSRWKGELWLDSDDWEGNAGWGKSMPAAQRLAISLLEKNALRGADRVSVVSRLLEQRLQREGRSPASISRLPNGVEHFPPPVQRTWASRHLLFYSRLAGIDPARAGDWLGRLLRQYPTIALFWLGQPITRQREIAFQAALRENEVWPRVWRIGWPDALRWQFMLLADFAVYLADDNIINASKFPVRLLEMMAAGLPVLSESVGDIPLLIEHNQSGWLVRPGHFDDLIQGSDHMFHADLFQKWGSSARQIIREHYWWPQMRCPYW